MSANEIFTLTKREKRHEARRAVLFAMQIATDCTVRAEGEEADLCKKVLGIIEHYGFSAFPLDERDVVLALWALHAQRKVQVGHLGLHCEREHVVTLIRA